MTKYEPRYYTNKCRACNRSIEGQDKAMIEIEISPGRKLIVMAHAECAAEVAAADVD